MWMKCALTRTLSCCRADDGKVVKAVSVIKHNWDTEELILEELTVFQSPTPILSMKLSTKRQQLYVSGELSVAQLGLQRCELYGTDCAKCCLARDPYCSWDGQTCSRFFPTSKRRARRQDVKYGDPWSQCPVTEDGEFDMKSLYIRGSERRISSIDHVFKVTQRWNAEPRWSSLFVHIRDRHKSTAVFDSHVWIHPEAPAPPVFSLSRVFSLSCVYTGNVLEDSDAVEEKSVYGVEGNSTFLECVPWSPPAELRWTVQRHTGSSQQTEDRLPHSDDDHSLHMKRGLLVQRLELADAGVYTCSSHEHSYSQVLARYRVHIIPNHSLHPAARHQQSHGPNHGKTGPVGGALPVFLGQSGASHPPSSLPGLGNSWPPQHRSYKDLHMVGTKSLSVDEYCEQLWYREKRRQQKLRTLKLKQESRKARVRRNNPPEVPL
ncbi:semaphorin-3D-like isoform X1 [Paralichthys olivaceus]|uniref:semaphorin-3D-like isoform X1 n=2 Tax=Paralichthys olivaceus TaxID=8255 RepID=UPI003750117D